MGFPKDKSVQNGNKQKKISTPPFKLMQNQVSDSVKRLCLGRLVDSLYEDPKKLKMLTLFQSSGLLPSITHSVGRGIFFPISVTYAFTLERFFFK